ncbi:MAG: hypothetical protein K6F55_10010, partial [Eubacterium sp.]|nr:hypothetical protein [Eubacterium sp.]
SAPVSVSEAAEEKVKISVVSDVYLKEWGGRVYSYDTNGLLENVTYCPEVGEVTSISKFKYKGKKLVEYIDAEGKTTEFKYDKKNRLKSLKKDGRSIIQYKCYKNGRVKTVTWKTKNKVDQIQGTYKEKRFYKKNKLVKTSFIEPWFDDSKGMVYDSKNVITARFKYYPNGMLKSINAGKGIVGRSYSYKYNSKKQPIKITKKAGTKQIYNITYKEIEVPKSYVKTIKNQQKLMFMDYMADWGITPKDNCYSIYNSQ